MRVRRHEEPRAAVGDEGRRRRGADGPRAPGEGVVGLVEVEEEDAAGRGDGEAGLARRVEGVVGAGGARVADDGGLAVREVSRERDDGAAAGGEPGAVGAPGDLVDGGREAGPGARLRALDEDADPLVDAARGDRAARRGLRRKKGTDRPRRKTGARRGSRRG